MIAYDVLLDCLVRAVVGRKVYMSNRMTKPLSEWFTYTDEAFLLLCLESYVPKWNRAWSRKREEGLHTGVTTVAEDAKYTGKGKGTKLGWTKAGLERMNALMIDVARDRHRYGAGFDNMVLKEHIRKYGTVEEAMKPDDENVAALDEQVIVYSDFNLRQLLEHAAVGEDDDGGDDNDDAPASVQI